MSDFLVVHDLAGDVVEAGAAVVAGPRGAPGESGAGGATLTAGTVTTGAAGSSAAAELVSTGPGAYRLDFTIPRGDAGGDGTDGAAGSSGRSAELRATADRLQWRLAGDTTWTDLILLTAITGPAGTNGTNGSNGTAGTSVTSAAINGSGRLIITLSTGATIDAGTAKGADGTNGAAGAAGPANTLTIGTVTTGAAGTSAAATVTGTAPNQTLNLTLPRGATGADGTAGTAGAAGQGVATGGTAGQVLTKTSGTDYATAWAQPHRPYTAPSGKWQNSSNFLGSAGAALVSGTIYLVPFDVGPTSRAYTSLACYCSTAQSGGTVTGTLGLYADDGTGGMPDFTQLLETGAITFAAAGRKAITFGGGTRTLTPGRFWGAFLYVATSAPTTAPQCNNISNVAPALWIDDTSNPGVTGRALTVVAATLPTTGGQTVTSHSGSNAPALVLKAA